MRQGTRGRDNGKEPLTPNANTNLTDNTNQRDQNMDDTKKQYDALYQAYRQLNTAIFQGELQCPLITISNPVGAQKCVGYYHRRTWTNGVEVTSEIALIREFIGGPRTDRELLSTMLHEMCHQWECEESGHEPRSNYHTARWAAKMEEVGLIPIGITKGKPNGKKTGQAATHKIPDEGGMFNVVYQDLINFGWSVPYTFTLSGVEAKKKPTAGKQDRCTYTCPSCEEKVTGKHEIQVVCWPCKLIMTPPEG